MDRPWLKQYDPGVPAHLEYPRVPLYALLDESAARHPGAPCLCFFGARLSYRRVKELSERLAAGVRGMGIRPGDRVALLLPNCPQFVVVYFGLLKAGAVAVSMNPLSSEREIVVQGRDSGVRAVVTIPMFLKKAGALRAVEGFEHVVCSRLAGFMPFPLSLVQGLREWRDARASGVPYIGFGRLVEAPPPPDFRPEPVDPDCVAVMLYSGGTTGAAKGIMLSHYNCIANAYQLAAWGELTEQDRLLTVLPVFHGYGMSVNMNLGLLVGAEIILVPRFKARDVAAIIQKRRPTMLTGVPTMYAAFNNLPDISRYDFSSLRGAFVGAAPLTPQIKETFEARTGGRMLEGYGLTEAVTAIMANPLKGQHKVGSIGIPFPDVDMKIVGLDDDRELPPGEQGEIVLRSPTLMLGYHNRPDATHEAIRDGWLYTGDIGYMDEDGYFYITDRKKDLIIVGGFNVFPSEIDELIAQHPKVKEGIAIGVPDPYLGEHVKVFLVLKDGEGATCEEMIAYFREALTPYKVPKEIEFRRELPKSMLGKILRRELR